MYASFFVLWFFNTDLNTLKVKSEVLLVKNPEL